MIQLNKSDNQFGSLDPEKIYFVEKFGYLIRKLNEGYGDPIQEVLFNRINRTVSDFKAEIPFIIHNLEMTRLISISNRNKEKMDTDARQSDYKSVVSSKSPEITKKINERIKSIQKTTSDKVKIAAHVKSEKSQEKQTQHIPVGKPPIKRTVIEKETDIPIDDTPVLEQSNYDKKDFPILKPTIAAIREKKRSELLKLMGQRKKVFNTESVRKQQVTEQKPQPVQELKEWERKWHKYVAGIIDKNLNDIPGKSI
jgi:hypothetical protein